jgi:hypothetical protein
VTLKTQTIRRGEEKLGRPKARILVPLAELAAFTASVRDLLKRLPGNRIINIDETNWGVVEAPM